MYQVKVGAAGKALVEPVWKGVSFVPGSKLLMLGMVIPPIIRNPYNGYINPYYWVDDHPLLSGNNGSLVLTLAHMFCFGSMFFFLHGLWCFFWLSKSISKRSSTKGFEGSISYEPNLESSKDEPTWTGCFKLQTNKTMKDTFSYM